MLRRLGQKAMATRRNLPGHGATRRRMARSRPGRLAFEALEPRLVLDAGPLLISEFMADNDTTLADEDGDYSDWIEIYNAGDDPADLDDWYLTDRANDLDKWQFPAKVLDSGEYLLVFASGKNRTDPASELHTNFSLNDDGEYLGLIKRVDLTPEYEYAPEFPKQVSDVSYGISEEIMTSSVLSGLPLTYMVPTIDDESLGTDWTEPIFSDTQWNAVLQPSGVLITETATGDLDYVEIQNVSELPASTAGWVVAANDARFSNINDVHGLWHLSGTMARDEILYRTGSADDNYWGERINWRTTGPGWALLMDDTGHVVDFVVWGYSEAMVIGMNVAVNGYPVNGAEIWDGATILSAGTTDNSLQRRGTEDNDHRTDWAFVPQQTKGTTNAGLETPLAIEPLTALGFDVESTGLTGAVQVDVQAQMYGQNASLWARYPFEVSDPSALDAMLLRVKYNDGFVAYLNGEEIASRNAPDPLLWNSAAPDPRDVADSLVYEEIDVSNYSDRLQAGVNVLAIHGLNHGAGDQNFLNQPALARSSVWYFAVPTPGEINTLGEGPPTDVPVFSHLSDIFVDPFTLELSAPSGAIIHYTTDGSIPNASSPLFPGSGLLIDTTTRIRARAIEPGKSFSLTVGEGFVFLDSSVSDFEGSGESFSSDLPLIVFSTHGLELDDIQLAPTTAVFIEPDADGRASVTDEPDYIGRSGLRIRGQSSQGFEKKQYALETWGNGGDDSELVFAEFTNDLAVSLLGLPEESDWVINGPYSDKSLMRNYLSYTWSNKIGNYAPRTVFAEVFVDTGGGPVTYPDDYVGVYVFMEKIKRDTDRVDVADLLPGHDSEPEITGGYIYKKDKAGFADRPWTTDEGQVLRHVEPKAREITPEQQAYLEDYINAFENALYNLPNDEWKDPDVGYPAYINPATWIDNWIMVEMTKNIDGFRLSTYYYKDRNGKINMGPLWDYNLSLGNADYLEGWLTEEWYWEQGGPPTQWDALSDYDYPYWRRLFEDPDFEQLLVDRWAELRQDEFSTAELMADVDAAADTIDEAQARNFEKWPVLSTYLWPNWFIASEWRSGDPDHPGEIEWMKQWLTDRVAWIDTQFLAEPNLMDGLGDPLDEARVITPGLTFTIDAPSGSIYYTLDGSDPRASGGDVRGLEYLAPVAVDTTSVLTVRAFDGSRWSAPSRVVLLGNTPADAANLAITEINYNPYDPQPASGRIVDDFEFIEFQNLSHQTIDVAGVELVDGAGFDFAAHGVLTLAPHQRMVVVKNEAAFASRYDTSGILVVGQFDDERSLANDGEGVTVLDAFGQTLLDFSYSDSGNWPGRADGKGASLELINPAAVPVAEPERTDYLEDGEHWRSSIAYGGTPGAAPQAELGIVVNEVFTHSGVTLLDAIELHNTGLVPINVGGWYLSDSWGWESSETNGNYKKYRIRDDQPQQTTILPGAYLVFDEDDFNPTPENQEAHHFALSGLHGDDVWLMKADAAGNLTHFGDHVDFPAAAPGESFGRWPNGRGELYPMTELTLGDVNSRPRVGPVVISEVQYYPGIFHENFNEDGAERFTPAAGQWAVSDGQFGTAPTSVGEDTVATINLGSTLWTDYVLQAETVAAAAVGGYAANAVLVFDYQGPDDFKFAGVFLDQNQCQIGHRDAAGWTVDALLDTPLQPGVKYDLKLRVEGSMAALSVEGEEAVSFDFGEPLEDGSLGIGTANAAAWFDAVSVEPLGESDLEYIELYNPTGETVELAAWRDNPYLPAQYLADWRLRKGVDMEFDPGTTIAPFGTLVVLSFNPTKAENADRVEAFRGFYGIDASVPLAGGYDGKLSNGGEQVQLQRPGEPPADESYFIAHYIEDDVIYDDLWPWPEEADGNDRSLHRLSPNVLGDNGGYWVADTPSPGAVPFTTDPMVLDRHVFYNNSTFDNDNLDPGVDDDLAMALDKDALCPGEKATFKNYTSYSRGINGIMIDIAYPAAEPTIDDFEFKVGNDIDPTGWTPAPDPLTLTVRPGAGTGGSDRVTVTWVDYAIRGKWLQVTVLDATPIGLATPDVFYFGNAVAESGNMTDNAQVTTTDLLLARNNSRNFLNAAGVDYHYDFNRDRFVNSTDVILARNNQTDFTNWLNLIDLSALGEGNQAVAAPNPATVPDDPSPATNGPSPLDKLVWLYEYEQISRLARPSTEGNSNEKAADVIWAAYDL